MKKKQFEKWGRSGCWQQDLKSMGEWNEKAKKYSRTNKQPTERTIEQKTTACNGTNNFQNEHEQYCAVPSESVNFKLSHQGNCVELHRILAKFSSVTSLSQNKLIKRWIQFYILIFISIRRWLFRWLSAVSVLLTLSLCEISHICLFPFPEWSSLSFFKWSISIWTSHTQNAHVSRKGRRTCMPYMKLFV